MCKNKVKTDQNYHILLSTQQLRRLFCSGKNLHPFITPCLKLNLKSCKISYWSFYLPKFFALDFFVFAEDDEVCSWFVKATHRFFNLVHKEWWSESECQLAVTDCEMMQLVMS